MGRQCLALCRFALGSQDSEVLVVMSTLAQVLSDAGEHAEAVRVGRECLKLQQNVLGKESEDACKWPARRLRPRS